MPYVDKTARADLDPHIAPLSAVLDEYGPGELTYVFTRLADNFATRMGSFTYAESVSDILGALEATKLEFYSQVVGQYEALKRTLNGDTYPKSRAAVQAAYERSRQKLRD